jgi:hypothetical protein
MLKAIRKNLTDQIEGTVPKDLLPTATEFSIEVEICADENSIDLLDALTKLVEEYRLDECDIKKLLTKALTQKLGIEQGIIKAERPLPLG